MFAPSFKWILKSLLFCVGSKLLIISCLHILIARHLLMEKFPHQQCLGYFCWIKHSRYAKSSITNIISDCQKYLYCIVHVMGPVMSTPVSGHQMYLHHTARMLPKKYTLSIFVNLKKKWKKRTNFQDTLVNFSLPLQGARTQTSFHWAKGLVWNVSVGNFKVPVPFTKPLFNYRNSQMLNVLAHGAVSELK